LNGTLRPLAASGRCFFSRGSEIPQVPSGYGCPTVIVEAAAVIAELRVTPMGVKEGQGVGPPKMNGKDYEVRIVVTVLLFRWRTERVRTGNKTMIVARLQSRGKDPSV